LRRVHWLPPWSPTLQPQSRNFQHIFTWNDVGTVVRAFPKIEIGVLIGQYCAIPEYNCRMGCVHDKSMLYGLFNLRNGLHAVWPAINLSFRRLLLIYHVLLKVIWPSPCHRLMTPYIWAITLLIPAGCSMWQWSMSRNIFGSNESCVTLMSRKCAGEDKMII
jgi:hypothetical protein